MEFEEGLLDLRKSSGLICLMLCCPCYCTACLVQSAVVSKATKTSQAWACLLSLTCCCIGTALNRGVVRRQYHISGTWYFDLLAHFCCLVCAIAQEYREVNAREGKESLGLLGKQYAPLSKKGGLKTAPTGSFAFYE